MKLWKKNNEKKVRVRENEERKREIYIYIYIYSLRNFARPIDSVEWKLIHAIKVILVARQSIKNRNETYLFKYRKRKTDSFYNPKMPLKIRKLLGMIYNEISEFFGHIPGAGRPSKCLAKEKGIVSKGDLINGN